MKVFQENKDVYLNVRNAFGDVWATRPSKHRDMCLDAKLQLGLTHLEQVPTYKSHYLRSVATI